MVDRASLASPAEAKKEPLFEGGLRTVRVTLEEDAQIAEHNHPGTEILFFVVEGGLELSLDDENYELEQGDLVRFEGERTISGRAGEPTTALVVPVDR